VITCPPLHDHTKASEHGIVLNGEFHGDASPLPEVLAATAAPFGISVVPHVGRWSITLLVAPSDTPPASFEGDLRFEPGASGRTHARLVGRYSFMHEFVADTNAANRIEGELSRIFYLLLAALAANPIIQSSRV
jgi:hypothetical protein